MPPQEQPPKAAQDEGLGGLPTKKRRIADEVEERGRKRHDRKQRQKADAQKMQRLEAELQKQKAKVQALTKQLFFARGQISILRPEAITGSAIEGAENLMAFNDDLPGSGPQLTVDPSFGSRPHPRSRVVKVTA